MASDPGQPLGSMAEFMEVIGDTLLDHYHFENPERAAAIKEFTGKDPVLVEGKCLMCPDTWPEEDLPVIEFRDGSVIGPPSKIEKLKRERGEAT